MKPIARTAALIALAGSLAWTAIAGAATAPRYIVAKAAPADTGFWAPNRQQAGVAEKALRIFLVTPVRAKLRWPLSKSSEAARQTISLDSDVLQFMGVRQGMSHQIYALDGKGPRQIYIGGFCHAPAGNLASDLVIVADGGACNFQAIYDLHNRAIVYFAVNGRG